MFYIVIKHSTLYTDRIDQYIGDLTLEYPGYVIAEVQRRIELSLRLLDRADEKDALTHGQKHNYLAVVVDQLSLCLRDINREKAVQLSDNEPNSIPF